mmetsp:Transcript_149304/g.416138  ORF Transcript_149304/g.416138 Transcript_149304/m.416138 type:complete len:213 (+) Transcript_149304:1057-1695(+)
MPCCCRGPGDTGEESHRGWADTDSAALGGGAARPLCCEENGGSSPVGRAAEKAATPDDGARLGHCGAGALCAACGCGGWLVGEPHSVDWPGGGSRSAHLIMRMRVPRRPSESSAWARISQSSARASSCCCCCCRCCCGGPPSAATMRERGTIPALGARDRCQEGYCFGLAGQCPQGLARQGTGDLSPGWRSPRGSRPKKLAAAQRDCAAVPP